MTVCIPAALGRYPEVFCFTGQILGNRRNSDGARLARLLHEGGLGPNVPGHVVKSSDHHYLVPRLGSYSVLAFYTQ